jgi:hypothetical protein
MSLAWVKRCATAAAIALVFVVAGAVHAADMQELMLETQRFSNASLQLTMVWWIPQEF